MNFEKVLDLARSGRLYPAVILFGSTADERQRASVEIGRILLCEADPEARPCAGREQPCRHCRRLAWPGDEGFHPDFHVLERDLRTSTSVESTREFLRGAYEAPFEARGQVFVIAEADTLGDGAADAFLKILEEPPTRSPRHFLLLAPSRLDLLPTLRSRSLSVFLGSSETLDEAAVDGIADEFHAALASWLETSSPLFLLSAAAALAGAGGWEDPRARKPWAIAAAAIVRSLERWEGGPGPPRAALLALAEALLDGPRMRVRAVKHDRILEGLLARHLA